MMTQSEQIDSLAAALVKAQGEIEGAKKDSTNPHFKSKYADLASVWDACRGPLSKNGLAVLQMPRAFDGEMRLVTRLMHSSGQFIEDDGCPLILGKQDMQGLGSASTYARRYGLMAMIGIAPEDDDGNASVGSGNGQRVAANSSKPAAPKNDDATQKANEFVAGLIGRIGKCTTADALQDEIAAIHDAEAAKMERIKLNYPDQWQAWVDASAQAYERVQTPDQAELAAAG